jgi:hypothetical protein
MSLNLKETWILCELPPHNPPTPELARELWGLGSHSFPLGEGEEVAPLGATGGVLEVSPSVGMILQTMVSV